VSYFRPGQRDTVPPAWVADDGELADSLESGGELKQREMRPKGVNDVTDRDRGGSLGHVQAFEARARRQFADGVASTIGESVALLASRCLGERKPARRPLRSSRLI
jgi:hypothetical protein